MTVVIKICGLTTPEALDAALEAGADMVGFVFFPASPRHVDVEAARAAGARGILVPTPRTRREEVATAPEVASDLAAAVDLLLDIQTIHTYSWNSQAGSAPSATSPFYLQMYTWSLRYSTGREFLVA